MTDRFHGLTVILEKEIREDDADHIINAIKQLKGVAGVTGIVADPASYCASESARYEVVLKLHKMLRESYGPWK